MLRRLLIAGVVMAELSAAAVFGVVVAAGSLAANALMLAWLLGIAACLSAALAWALPARRLGKLALHGALIIGCIIFSLPFVWLVSTTFKSDAEVFVYPPRWVPAIPERPLRSPYVTDRLFDHPVAPAGVDASRWGPLWETLEPAIWARGVALLDADAAAAGDLPGRRRALVLGLWDVVSAGVRRTTWSGPDAAIVQAVTARITPQRVAAVWDRIYRSVELRDVTVKDLDLIERPLGPAASYLDRWEALPGQAVKPVRRGGDDQVRGNASLTLAYDLTDAQAGGVTAVFPLPVAPQRLHSITLPMRQDRSWHHLGLVLEVAGKRYVPQDGFNLDQWRWQELTFKIKSRDNSDQRDLGIWPLVEVEDARGVFDEAGKFRLTLTIGRISQLGAIFEKYTDSYQQAYLVTENAWRYVFNSLYLVVLTVLGQMLSCSLVAYAFARLRWPGRDVMFVILLATMMLPPQVTMVPVFLIFEKIGWYNTLKTLWVPAFLGTPFFIFLLRQFMRSVPRELEDAAQIDGCGFFGTYWRIILPLMKPALAAVAIFTFMGTWNDFMGPLIYLNDQRLYPLSLGLFDFRTQHGSDFRMLMAASTLMTLPVIAVFFLAQRYFIEGVTLTGLKG